MTADEIVYSIATANRLLAADMFEGLSEDQWRTPSLCAGWTVREILAHLVPPGDGFTLRTVIGPLIRYRGNLDRMVDDVTRRRAQRPVAELVRQLRERAGARLKAPVVGAGGPMADTAIHLRDAARPLGLDVNPDPAVWAAVLDFLVSRPASRGFMPRHRLDGLRLAATNAPWSWGEGLELRGPGEALALAAAGRPVVLPDLSGPGVPVLSRRLSGHS